MRIRPYIESKDFEHVEQWIDTEKIHALWCAGLIPYPVTRQNLRIFLEKNAEDWTAGRVSMVLMPSDCRFVNTGSKIRSLFELTEKKRVYYAARIL